MARFTTRTNAAPFRVIFNSVNTASGRGIGGVVAIVEDAKDIGASEQANGAGEFFMTLPINHPQASAILPLKTHYTIQRINDAGSGYTTIFRGLVDDYDADKNEVVFYGRDWLSLLDTSISSSNTSYTNTYIGTIINNQLTAAINATNSRVGFITVGSIDTTSTTTTVITSYQSRLEFLAQVVAIGMADRTVRSILQVYPRTSDTPAFRFQENQGSNLPDLVLEYGGLANDYFYSPGFSTLGTAAKAVGQKREGATLLYSTQTSSLATAAEYGLIEQPMLFIDVVNQTALDNRAKRAARAMARVGKTVGLGMRVRKLGPWDGYDLGDSVRVVINRGPVSVNGYYTIWGVEWIGKKNGSEELVLSLVPKDE